MLEFVDKFISQWRALEIRGNTVDYERAILVQQARKAMGPEELSRALSKVLEVGPTRVNKVMKQAEVVSVVTNKKVWTAVGWLGVCKISTLNNVQQRRDIEHAVLDLADLKGRVLSKKALDTVFSKYAPSLLAKTRVESEYKENVFKAELERLVREGYLHESLVAEEVRRRLSLEESASTTAPTTVSTNEQYVELANA